MMKNSRAISIVFISIVIIIIISTFGDASTYVTFSKAKDVYQSGSMSKFHVVGKLNKNDNNKIEGIKNSPDKLSFTFEMIDEVNASVLLKGFRGASPKDIEALAHLLVNLSQLGASLSEDVKELDLNPVMVLDKGQGVKAADALVIL